MSIPIVLIHTKYGNDYLLYSLAQVKKSNPNSSLILIGDNTNDYYRFVQHENILKYSREAENFVDIYQHYSPNSFGFELFCFQRWFILRSFLKANNLNKCLYIDSDVMLYANLDEEKEKFQKYDLTLSCGESPHFTYINNFDALDGFCKFIIEMYTNLSILEELKLKASPYIQTGVGGISDMTAFDEFRKKNYFTCGEISSIINESIYDHNINCAQGFETKNGIKNIYFIDQQPFCKYLESGKPVKFSILHFQGYETKRYIKDYFIGEIFIKEISKYQNLEIDNKNKLLDVTNYSKSIKSIPNLSETYVALNLNLNNVNLIIFPDWTAEKELLFSELEKVVTILVSHPDNNNITLLIDTSNASEEDANFALLSLTMNCFHQEEFDVDTSMEISLVGKLNEIQWRVLLSCIQSRIILENENKSAIVEFQSEKLPTSKVDSLIQMKAVQLETGSWNFI